MRLHRLGINSIFNTIASIKLNKFNRFNQINLISLIKDLETGIGKKLLHDTMTIEGIVEITNGDNHIIAKNSVVDQGLLSFINYLSTNALSNVANVPANLWPSATTSSSMRLGSDNVTGTIHSTTALTSPIGTGIGTAPNTQSISNSNPIAGQYQATYTATWNAGTVSGTLGEVGLFLNIWTVLQTAGAAANPTTFNTLFSRMASADGKFTAFTINNTVPLSVAWNFRLTYSV